MKKIITVAALLFSAFSFSQVGIGTITPDDSAVLDVTSITQGFLPPRLSYVQRNAIVLPVAGLQIWCSNCGSYGEAQVYNGISWTNISGSAALGIFPTITSATVTSITELTATSGGSVSSDGGSAIIARGVCWNTYTTPTTANSKTSDTGTIGTFTSGLTGLTGSTIYYIRAYATNSSGTSYGNQIAFTTNRTPSGQAICNGTVPTIVEELTSTTGKVWIET